MRKDGQVVRLPPYKRPIDIVGVRSSPSTYALPIAPAVGPARVRLVSPRIIRAQRGAVGAEPFDEVGNRMKGQTV